MSLKEIAHRAGTSVSTVSRVLNQPDYKCKNPELEARIWAAAQEISYTPNTAAQTLKSGAPQIKTTPLTFDFFMPKRDEIVHGSDGGSCSAADYFVIIKVCRVTVNSYDIVIMIL